MQETNDSLWLEFEVLAKKYPHDDGVRMTAELARWLVEEHQRQRRLPGSPIMQKVVCNLIHETPSPATEAAPVTGNAKPASRDAPMS